MAVLLDPVTGKPESSELLAPSGLPMSLQGNADRGWKFDMSRAGGLDKSDLERAMSRAPANVLDMLERGRAHAGLFEPRASMQSWEELIYATIANGAQVLNTVTETIMVPDFTLPANYLYAGRALRYTILGNLSTVATTPGTITLALRYGGVAGTVLATSGAFAPSTTASTAQTCMVEWFFICRGAGTAAPSFTIGRMFLGNYDATSSTTIVGNLNMIMIPPTAPAAVNINTTTANALSPTIKFSVSTATTQFTANMAFLEALS